MAVIVHDDFGVQGRSESQRELLDAESVAGHLLKADSVFAFLAAHRGELFPDEMFADLFPTGRGEEGWVEPPRKTKPRETKGSRAPLGRYLSGSSTSQA